MDKEAARREASAWRSFVRLVAAQALTLAIICVVLQVMAGVGYRLGWWSLGNGFSLLRSATYGCVAAALLALADLSAFAQSRRALWMASLALVVGVLGASIPAYYWYLGMNRPVMNDISTDTANPPRFVAAVPSRKDARNPVEYGGASVAALQKQHYPDIEPVMLDMPPPEAFSRALAAALAMGWAIVAEVPAEFRIEATDTTLLFGFKDDIVIRVTPADKGSRVDVRSLSRIGKGDFGTNARRVQRYIKELRSRA